MWFVFCFLIKVWCELIRDYYDRILFYIPKICCLVSWVRLIMLDKGLDDDAFSSTARHAGNIRWQFFNWCVDRVKRSQPFFISLSGVKRPAFARFSKENKSVSIDVTGNRQCKDGDITRKWAIADKGIARKSKLDIIQDLIHGRLVEFDIDGWHGETFPLNLICAERRLLSPTINAFKQHLIENVTALFNQLK